jgi:uncharacterized membrane protein
MRYAREHVKRYWGFAYRRSIGISMLVFALILAVGTAFTNLVGSTISNGAIIEVIFWGMLLIIATMVLATSFAGAHISSVRLMNENEHDVHSKHMGAWLTVLVLGALAFVVPMLLSSGPITFIIFMFCFGGMLLLTYISVLVIFRHTYHELAIAAGTLWIVFVVSFAMANGVPRGIPINAYAIFISTVVVILVTGVTGMTMLFNASREFSKDFVSIATAHGKPTARRSSRRRSR